MKKLFLLLSLPFAFTLPAEAQFTFEKIDGGNGEDYATDIIKTSDGGFAVCGALEGDNGVDAYLLKTTAAGNTVWEKTFGGTEDEEFAGLVQTADGGYTLLFNNAEIGAAGGAYLLKTNSLGETVWQRKVAPTTSIAFVHTSDGGYAIAEQFPEGNYFSLIRTDADGDTLWTRHFNMDNLVNVTYDLIETSDGGFAFTGETNSSPTIGENDIFLIKTNANGLLQWDKRFGTSDLIEQGYALHQTADGGYLIGGTVIDALSGQSDAQLIKTNSAGVATWTKTYNYDAGAIFYQIEDITPTSDGNYMMCGWEGGFTGINGFLLEVNPQGDTLLNRFYPGQGLALLNSIIEDTDGQFVICGVTAISLDDAGEIYFFKTGFPVGIQNPEETALLVAPNPVEAGQFLKITLEGNPIVQYTLFDALGRIVWQQTGSNLAVPAPAERGIYTLVAATKDGAFVGRQVVVVQ